MTRPESNRGLDLLRQMTLIRRFEEKAAELYSVGKIRGFLHLYIGEEAALPRVDTIVATARAMLGRNG